VEGISLCPGSGAGSDSGIKNTQRKILYADPVLESLDCYVSRTSVNNAKDRSTIGRNRYKLSYNWIGVCQTAHFLHFHLFGFTPSKAKTIQHQLFVHDHLCGK
jgi:hypothetical protein